MTNQWSNTDYNYSTPLWDYPGNSNYNYSTTNPTWHQNQPPNQENQYPYSAFAVPPPQFTVPVPQFIEHPPPFVEHPPPFVEHPPPFVEHPPQFVKHHPQFIVYPPRYAELPPEFSMQPTEFTKHPVEYTDHPPDLQNPSNNIIVISTEFQSSVKQNDSYSYFGFASSTQPAESIVDKDIGATTNEKDKRNQRRKKLSMAKEKALHCLRAIHLLECAKYKEDPVSHPSYEKEKSMRDNFLISKGIDVHSKTMNEEWNFFWKKNLEVILQKDWEKKMNLYLADFHEKVDRGSPVPSNSSSSTSSYEDNVKSYRKRSSSVSSRSSCEKRRRKNKKYDRLSSSGSNENETINCKRKLHSHRSFSKEHDKIGKCNNNNYCETILGYSSKRHNKHHISHEINKDSCKKSNEEIQQQRSTDKDHNSYKKNKHITTKVKELVNESTFKYEDLKAASGSLTKNKEAEDMALRGDNVCTKTSRHLSPLAVKNSVDSLHINEDFENMSGSFHDFEMQIDDFKPMLRKSIKITLKGDKQSESSQIHSNNQDNFPADKVSAGNTHSSNNKTDNSENQNLKSYVRDIYEPKITKKAKNETVSDNAVLHTVTLSINAMEDCKANINSSADNYTSFDMFTKPTGSQSATVEIDKKAVELLGLFHSLSSNFGVLSLPITLLHDKLIEYKKKGSSLMKCFDEDAVALLEMISNKLNNFLKEPDISLVQSTVYELASSRLASLMTAVDKAKLEETVKSDTFFHGLDLFKMAIACEGKDCSETIRFIKISSLYQNLPELTSDQLMEAYVAIKSVQASALSQKKLSELIVPRSCETPLSYDTHHPNKERNSSLLLSEIPFQKSSTLDSSCGAPNVLIFPTLADPSKSPSSRKEYINSNSSTFSSSHKSTKTSVSDDKINISSSSNKSQHSSYISVCDKEKSYKIKHHKSSKSHLPDLKESEKHPSSKPKSLRTEHTNLTRSCSPKQIIIPKTVLDNKHNASSKSKHQNTSFPSNCQTKSSTLKQPCSSTSSSPGHKKSLKAKHFSSRSPVNQKKSLKLIPQNSLQSSSSQSKSLKMKPQSSSQSPSVDQKKSSATKHQYSSSYSSSSQTKSLKTKHRSSSHSSSSQMKSLKTKHHSLSQTHSVDQRKSSTAKRQNLSQSSKLTKESSLKMNHFSTRLSPDIKISKNSITSSVTEEKRSSRYDKGGHHYYSPDSPTSPEGQKLSSPLGKRSCSSKMPLSYDKKIDRKKNNYDSSQQKDNKHVFSLSLASVKPTPLSKFNIFEEFDDDIDYNAGIDDLKNRPSSSNYVFGKREPVELFLKNCISIAEEKYVRELYKRIHKMNAMEKIKYYIDYNSHSESVKRLLAVHADEVALVDPNLAQSMKWRIENVSKQNKNSFTRH